MVSAAGPERTQVISIEEHFLTPAILAAWEISDIGTEGTSSFDHGEVSARLLDLGPGRLALMDEGGIDVQVLSVTTPALHNLDRDSSVRLATATNDLLAEPIAAHPTRFQGFATLPMPAPNKAAEELRRAVTNLGLCGAMVCGRTRERNLDHPDFFPLLKEASDLHVPLFIHPQIPQAVVRKTLYSGFSPEVDTAFATFGLGWHYEAGIQFVRLVLAGVFDRLPDLQIILGHWGEVVLFYLERLRSLDHVARLDHPIETYFKRNLFVTPSGMWSRAYLQRAFEVVGCERILLSTDYPYQYRPGRAGIDFLRDSSLPESQQRAFANTNWLQLIFTCSSEKLSA